MLSFFFQRIEEMKYILQEIKSRRLGGVAIRSRVKWLQDGDKINQYVCNVVTLY